MDFWFLQQDHRPGDIWVEDVAVPEEYLDYETGQRLPNAGPLELRFLPCKARRTDVPSGIHGHFVVSGRLFAHRAPCRSPPGADVRPRKVPSRRSMIDAAFKKTVAVRFARLAEDVP